MKKFKTTILIVEDSPSQLKAINALAQKAGYETTVAQTLSDAKLVLAEKNFNIVLTDIHLNNGENTGGFEGFELLEFLKSEHPEVTPVGMSSDPDVEVYNGAVKRGAVQFVRKPFLNADEFKICIEQSVKMRISMRQSQLMKSPDLSDEALRKLCPDGVFIPPEQRDLAQRIAEKHDMVVCITGETGTGKEEIAKLIHRCRVATFGPTPFVPVNCANLN